MIELVAWRVARAKVRRAEEDEQRRAAEEGRVGVGAGGSGDASEYPGGLAQWAAANAEGTYRRSVLVLVLPAGDDSDGGAACAARADAYLLQVRLTRRGRLSGWRWCDWPSQSA